MVSFFKSLFKLRYPTIIFIFLGFLIYANSFSNQLFWDDQDNILNNAYIKDWQYFENFFSQNLIAGSGLLSNYWRPLLLLIYSLEWHLWQEWAPGYHFTNTILHIGVAAALYFLFLRLFKNRGAAFFPALIFLVHPLQTEAVTYVSGRADPLSSLFIFLGLLFYLKSKFPQKPYLKQKPPTKAWPSLLFFILALMTKEKSALLFPALLILIDLFLWFKNPALFLKNLSKTKLAKPTFLNFILREIKTLWSFFLTAAIYALLRATILNFKNTFNLYGEANPYTESLLVRIATFLKILPQYFKLIFLPAHLHMERQVNFETSFSNPLVILGLVLVLGLLSGAFILRRKKPHYSFAILWFLICLFPASGLLFPVSGLMYEHYLYLPLIGIFLLLTFLGKDLYRKCRSSKALSYLLVPVFAYVSFLCFKTIKQNSIWRDPITFYQNIIQYNSQSLRVWNNLGMAYAKEQQHSLAIEAYQRAIGLDSQNVSAPPRHNLGNIYAALEENEKALVLYKEALAIDQRFLFSYFTLARLYLNAGDYSEALAILKKAQEIFPQNPKITAATREVEKMQKTSP